MEKKIIIPNRLLEKLDFVKDVENLCSNVKDYFFTSPYFFSEYTDHGISHIQKLLDICNKVIPDKCLSSINHREMSSIIISIIIHDIGMFVQKDGLKELVFGKYKDFKIEHLDIQTWGELWQNYKRAVLRYSDQKLIQLFGDAEVIKFPPDDMVDMTDKEVLLCGNFLREQHGRLVHHICLNGFPGKQSVDIFRNLEIDNEFRDVLGLIARSHSMGLRDGKQYLEHHYANFKFPKNIAVFYVMTLLRISDYLDAGFDRAPHAIDLMQSKKSPLSIQEFSWNSVIDYDDYNWNYQTDTLSIHADPQNSNQFLKIEMWLQNLQRELDLSWAVLGEYYGNNLNKNLSIRRIDSNILKTETRKQFEKRFVIRKAIIDTNPDILKLLIYPLYDEDPRFGIRELIQNAVDACNERKVLEQSKGNFTYQGQISVNIDSKNDTITIKDNGIGMNAEIIINYYLISGASFRNSELWSKKFEIDGKSVIARTGKFGIGALATFLLGEIAYVKTRMFEKEKENDLGYSFEIEMSRENINIKRVTAEIGTEIVVISNKHIINQLVSNKQYPTWSDWFCFDSPSVKYFIDGLEKVHTDEYVPDDIEEFKGWFSLPTEQFKSYKWSYSYKPVENINSFCNGIPIPQMCELHGEKFGFDLSNPTISLIDFDNNAKLNLARSRLMEFPCEEEFVEVGFKYLIAQLLSLPDVNSEEAYYEMIESGFPLGKSYGYNSTVCIHPNPFLFYKNAFTLMSPTFLCKAKVDKLSVYCIKNSNKNKVFQKNEHPMNFCFIGEMKRRTFFLNSFTRIFEKSNANIMETLTNIQMKKSFFDAELKDMLSKEGVLQKLYLITETSDYYYYSMKPQAECLSSKLKTPYNIEQSNSILAVLTYEICYNEKSQNKMSKIINKYLGDDIWIPYKLCERKAKFPFAFKTLKRYMQPNNA